MEQFHQIFMEIYVKHQAIYNAIPFRVEQGTCREPPVLKSDSLQWEQDPCNENRFSLWLKQGFTVRMWAQAPI